MYRTVKRIIDVLVSLLGLIILSPLFLVLFLLIRLESKGPALFRQQRIGLHRKPFQVYKLRTMYTAAPSSLSKRDLADPDAYITRVGRVLRKTSLDELPQLYNVLRGEMSLVGPRPLVPGEGNNIHEERFALGAYDVRPGITGWAQVNGRDQVNAGKKAELDGYYAKNLSFALDMKIIFQSTVYVLTAKGMREGAQEPEAQSEEADAKRPAS